MEAVEAIKARVAEVLERLKSDGPSAVKLPGIHRRPQPHAITRHPGSKVPARLRLARRRRRNAMAKRSRAINRG